MSNTVTTVAAVSHRQRLEQVKPVMAKALKEIEIDRRRSVGLAVERALKLANLSQKEVSAALGHSDSAQVNRWIAGTERPQFDALFAVDALRTPMVIALAELAGEGVTVTTQITVVRRRA